MTDVCVHRDEATYILCDESHSTRFVDSFVRTPFQWDSTTSAGFSSNEVTWMPVSADYATNNLAEQQKDLMSHFNTYKNLQQLRNLDAIKTGKFSIQTINQHVFIFKR